MRTVLTRTLLASALVLGSVTSANAVPILRLTTSGGDIAMATDGGLGDANGTPGAVTFLGSLSGWSVNVTTGLSKPVLGSAQFPELDLNSVNVSSGSGPGWIELELTDTGFTAQSGAYILAALGGTTNGSVSYKTYFDASNTEFGRATEITSLGGLGPAFSGTADSMLTSATPFSLTLLVRIAHSRPGTSSFDATVKVPEPGTLLLLGAGFLALATVARRRAAWARGRGA